MGLMSIPAIAAAVMLTLHDRTLVRLHDIADELDMNVAHVTQAALNHPEHFNTRFAYDSDGRAITYAELTEQGKRRAAQLHEAQDRLHAGLSKRDDLLASGHTPAAIQLLG